MDSKPLLTIAEVGDFLNIRPGTNDARLSTLIALATASIETATGRRLTRQKFTEYLTTRDNQRTDYDFRGSSDYAVPTVEFGGMRTIVSPQSMPLVGVNIELETFAAWYHPYAGGPADYTDGYALRQNVDYQVDPEAARIHLNVATRFRMRALKVEYIAGYAAAGTDGNPHEVSLSASIPDWLRSAALIQAQFLNVKLRTENIGMAAERTVSEKGKTAMSAFLAVNGVTPEVVPLIAHLRRTGLGRG